MTMNKKTINVELLETMPVSKALIKLAIPSILASMVTTIYNISDTFFIGMLHNTAMIAATTVAMPVMMLTQAFGESIGVSASSYISRELGAGRKEKVSRIVQTTMTLAWLISIVLPLLFLLFLSPLMSIFGAEGEVIGYAAQYVSILLIFSFTLIVKLVMAHLLRGEGDVRFPMIAIFCGVITNIILDPIFMFEWGLNMGVAGAALATVLAQFVSMIMLTYRIIHRASYVRWNWKSWFLDWAVVKKIASLGVAVFARQALPSVTYSGLAYQAGRYGTEFLAGVGLAKKGLNLIMFAILGFTQGFQPFAAYNYGAKLYHRLYKAIMTSLRWLLVYGFIMSIMYVLFAPQIIQIFSQQPGVIEIGKMMLYGYALSMPIVGVYNLCAVLLQSLGESRSAFFLSIARQGLYYIPIVFLLPALWGKWGIYLAQPVADYLTIITVVFLCTPLIKKIHAWQDVKVDVKNEKG